MDELHADIGLLLAYDRGMFYISATRFMPPGADMQEWFNASIAPYTTALRYMTFAAMVNNYPRLIICGINFSAFMPYHKGIDDYIRNHKDFAEKLRVHVALRVGDRCIDIDPSKKYAPIPDTKFKVHQDIEHVEKIDSTVPIETQEYRENLLEFAESYDSEGKTKELEKTFKKNVVLSGNIKKRRGIVAKRRGVKWSGATITKYFNKMKLDA
jgi:hypothetical protein